ncbi:hypothetical protein BJ878DRAFT_415578 [Calycina marina]|uniref:RING-type domain-containing protein n=1 Tax=Calycina marina TaxID=1763456 RepID=A0A9P7Z8K5_9HELO|nr:hypothetical protein BJ878DRAFT_415578 [Calycina marina]
MENGIDLEKELTCAICTEILWNPLTLLDCLHSFCGSCLKEWFSHQLAQKAPYSCPSCRAKVRATKTNATVNTLVEMYLAANPEKARTAEEKEQLNTKYSPGEDVIPKPDEREMSLRDRRIAYENRRQVNEVQALSLRTAGLDTTEQPRHRSRRDGSTQGSRSQSSRDNSRDHMSAEDRERRRRRDADSERRRNRDDITSRTEAVPAAAQSRRASEDDARRIVVASTRSNAARQVEHQSSLRSLISASDPDSSQDMENEILRQIRDEGLLDGIDLENIDVHQEDQISERIAQAYRRRLEERSSRPGSTRTNETAVLRSASTTERQRNYSSAPAPESRDTSGDDNSRATRRRRTHSRTPSAASRREQSRPPQSISAIQATHLDVNSSDDTSQRRRRRTTSSSRRATAPIPAAEIEARPAARSQTDLSGSSNSRPQSFHSITSRPLISENRSSTDPAVQQLAELPAPDRPLRSRRLSQTENTPSSSPRIVATERAELSSPDAAELLASPRPRPTDIIMPSTSLITIDNTVDRTLLPAPLSPRVPDSSRISLSDRATAYGSVSRPNSSPSPIARSPTNLYPEPSLTCARCSKAHIEYELHYNCSQCSGSNYNICLSCYRTGKGCLYWFGFGYAAWRNWEAQTTSGKLPLNAENPHMLTASRYLPPKVTPGGADGRRTLTNEDPNNRLQSGAFCANCLTWANQCYWRCESCNEGDWGFCNQCSNRGKSCTHALLPLTYKPANPPLTPMAPQEIPASARILTGPGATGVGNFKPLTFDTRCDICRFLIQPTASRYHCFSCVSRIANSTAGDYDICTPCYFKLADSRRISNENGPKGWRRCLQGHRMAVIGFEANHTGEYRIIVQDVVGGRGLSQKPSTMKDPISGELQLWSWGDGRHADNDGTHNKLVTTDVMKSPPTNLADLVIDRVFPPAGGVGIRVLAVWSWYPQEGNDDELLFPKGAELRDCKDVNGDWFHATYMGKSGLFPSPYIRVLDQV